MASALVVIDYQVGVVEAAYDVEGTTARIASLVDRARTEGTPVVWVMHEEQGMEPDTEGWPLVPGIARNDDEPEFRKDVRDVFAVTDLETWLRKHDIDRLVLTGSQSDYCVRTAAQTAALKGFSIALVSDGHTTEDTEWNGVEISAPQIIAHTNRTFETLEYPGVTVEVVPAAEVSLN